ncbi:hypothetical protein F4803DRAFT_560574 [Xylaria telfairii]|nr:hypothetical protein F4803DRAFT_560574 [Xylaria telfairii]
MAEGHTCEEGNELPFTGDAYPELSPSPEPEAEAKPSNLIPARGAAPRGPRFSKLSDAYFKITSRQGPDGTFRKASNQSDPSAVITSLAGPALSPASSPRLVKSQNDLRAPRSVSATPGSIEIDRRTSFNSIEFLEDLSFTMGRKDNNHLGLSEQIEYELLQLKTKSDDTTGSTIEGILAQYDGCTSGLNSEHEDLREYRVNVDASLSRPPQDSLPQLPATDKRSVSLRRSEYDSPIPESSITDSQHLLDVEAQAYELEEARQALVPSPLNVAQPRYGIDIRREQQRDARDERCDLIVYEGATGTNDYLAHQEVQGYKTYLQPPIERDISQSLRHLGGKAAHSIATFCSSDFGDYLPQQIRPQGKIFNPARLPKASREKPLRQIKVVIGRESEDDEDTQERHNAQGEVKRDCRDMLSEDGDWVTETTSDTGFGLGTSALPGQLVTKRFKRAGSSLADYSDDGKESTVEGFGSRERIISPLRGGETYGPSDIQRLNASKLAFLLPRQHNTFLRNANRLWANTTQQDLGQFRSHITGPSTKPSRQMGTRRLVFDFDQNAPPKYAFRDSVSDYEPSKDSTKSNCGANQYDTYGSLPSSVSQVEEDHRNTIRQVHFDQNIDPDCDRNPLNRSSRQSRGHQNPRYSQDVNPSIYEADRRKQVERLELQEFAAASSYCDPPSTSSVRSKFNFELLPLDLARHKNKQQRNRGETNETDSATARLKRKKSSQSINHLTGTIERPEKAFFTSRDLSLNFSTPNWRIDNLGSEDTPVSFLMGRPDEIGRIAARKDQQSITPGSLDSPSPFGVPSIMKHPYNRRKERHPTRPAQSRRQFVLPSGFTAPDDYVSDRADRTRRLFFCIIVILSILPFVGILALGGAFKEALKWATRSEVDRLTARQRRVIKWMLFFESVIYTGAVVTVVVYFVLKSKVQN